MKNKHLFKRVGFAMSGLCFAFAHEKSLRFQIMAFLFVCVLLFILQPSIYWWAIVFVVVAMVIAAELFNTAIEAVCDYIQPNMDERIKIIKDVAAAAVLVTSLAAVVIAFLLLMDLFFF